ncbi:hypothetical protein AB00_1356 [Raoultella ornithinolytica 2-156-04_S1_C1]|nr:hypothetical protein AB00_1356 [Raoultella ornithinolytica 2-156-04_S1_C1]
MNHVSHGLALGLQPFDNGVTVNFRTVDYQLNDSPANLPSYKSSPVFQQLIPFHIHT